MTKDTLQMQREALVRRSILLREKIAHEATGLKPVARAADVGLDVGAWIRANPTLVLGAVGVLVVMRPKRMLGLGLRAWGLWRVGSRFLPVLRVLNNLRR